MKKIERLYDKANKLQTKMLSAKEDFEREVVFSDEFEEEPIIAFAGDGELIAYLDDGSGRECSAKDIVRCMLTKGIVEDKDFY